MVGFCQKSGKLAKARCKKVQLQSEKKAFGVAYMDMINQGSSEQDLQLFVNARRNEILNIQEEINVLKTEAISIDDKIKQKLVRKKTPRGSRQQESTKKMFSPGTSSGEEQVVFSSELSNCLGNHKDPPPPLMNASSGSKTESSDEEYILAEPEPEFVVVDSVELVAPSAPPASMDLDDW